MWGVRHQVDTVLAASLLLSITFKPFSQRIFILSWENLASHKLRFLYILLHWQIFIVLITSRIKPRRWYLLASRITATNSFDCTEWYMFLGIRSALRKDFLFNTRFIPRSNSFNTVCSNNITLSHYKSTGCSEHSDCLMVWLTLDVSCKAVWDNGAVCVTNPAQFQCCLTYSCDILVKR